MKRTALKRRTPLARGSSSLKRGGFLARRRLEPRGVVEREASLAWKVAVGPCVVCPVEGGTCGGEVQGHHAIAQQTLKRRGFHAFLWDTRNKVDVCTFRHEQHTSGYRPIPREALPPAVFKFAAELGLGWWVDRFYPAAATEAAA